MPSISGIISTTSGVVNTDVIITAYDVDLINQQRLGEITLQGSFSSQSFQIRYFNRQYQSAEGSGTADIQVRASTLDGLLAAETEIIFNAPDEVTDVRLELRPVENPASELERLVESLTPLMESVDPADLTPAQMAFLSRDSRERRSRIFTWHEAAILTRDTGIPVESGYGWWRRLGRPHTLTGLLDQDESLLRSTLVGAIRSNIIPPFTNDQIDDILARLNSFRTRVVFGTFTFDPPSREPITNNVIIQAYDRDFRSEELLGEVIVPGPFGPPGSIATGDYRIEYTDAQFQQNEARTADIIVRAQTEDALYTAESTTLFNAGPEERINLTLIATEPPEVETPDPSELEQLQADLEPIREKVPYANFTDDDLQFLAQELRQPNSRTDLATLEQRLNFLRIAAQHEQTIDVPLAAFYGWFRQSLSTDLAALLDIPIPRLQTALETAIREAIIPDITAQIPDILDAIRVGRIEQGRLVNHRFVAQLINAQTNQPLGNILADVTDLDADPDDQDNGITTGDGQGLLVLDFVLPGDAPTDASRRLQLTLRDEARTLATVEVDAVANQTEVVQIPVTIELTAEEQTPIRDRASPALTTRLSDLGIATIDDLLSNPTLLEEEDDDELIRLRDRAKIAVLNPDLTEEQQTYLLDNGLASPQAIARISRAEFVERHREGLGGDAAAYTLYQVNWDVVKAMHNQVASTRLQIGTSPDDEDDDDPDIPEGVRDIIEDQTNNCGCEDCTSAVSPAAYLAYLLDWMLIHIKSQGATVAFADFVDQFHQPFGDLPANCEAVTQEVRQVRLVVESLWRFIDRLDEPDSQLLTPFRNAYRHLRNQLYKAILTNLGVSYDQLRRASLTIEGEGLTADQVAAQRTAIANILGVDESVITERNVTISGITGLFINVDRASSLSPSEEVLELLFGYENTRKSYPELFASRQRPQLISWQREQLESQWQVQDWTDDDYVGPDRFPQARLPYIDPALIDETYLRTPLDTNPAFALLRARQSLLADHRQGMVESTSTDLAGLDTLLESELSQSIDQLQTWFTALQDEGDESAITAARDAIDALRLTLAGFSHLMEIRATMANGESLGDTDTEVEAAWNSVFDILSRVHRRRRFLTWAEQEEDGGIVFGPKLFWPSVEPLPINPWLASEGEQAAWLAALAHRSQPPLIDPDQIPREWVLILRVVRDIQASREEQNSSNVFVFGFNRYVFENPLDAPTLWEQRRTFVDRRITELGFARQSATNSLDALDAMLTASNTGLTLETLLELREQEAAGADIAPRLEQLTLARSAYRFLAEVHILTEADTSISVDMWDSAEAILVQVEKQREFAGWRSQEQELQITLHPNQFQILTSPDKVADSVRSEWLHNPRFFNRWVATLEARQDQFETLETALASAVSAAEGQILMQLRNLLISDSNAPGDTLREQAEWLDKRLLMDMFMDGCHMTTRVSQAIETLQRLVRGVYTQEHIEALEELTLDAVEDYEAEWPVMGTYATWRAYMLAYLFPENLLHLSPPTKQSHGLDKLYKALPSRINEQQACQLATRYGAYFQDVCNLEVQATCQLQSVYIQENDCDPVSNLTSSFTHVFARSTVTGTVYWAYFNSSDYSSDNISTWTPLGRLGEVDFILGATPHQTPSGQKLLLLFASTATDILMRKFDVSEGRWLGITKLDWPEGYENGISMGTVIQKRQTRSDKSDTIYDFPTLVSVTLKEGSSYIRTLSANAESWVSEEWKPVYGPSLFDEIDGVHCLAQIGAARYAIFANFGIKLHFRIEEVLDLDSYTYEWQKIANGSFQGVTTPPHSGNNEDELLCFYKKNQSTRYKQIEIEPRFKPDEISFSNIADFNENWLIPNVGISLDDTSLYEFDRYVPNFFIPLDIIRLDDGVPVLAHPVGWNPFVTKDPNGNTIPLNQDEWNGDPYYSGSIFGLIVRDINDFHFIPPKNSEYDDLEEEDHYFYLVQQKYYGIQEFIRFLDGIDNVDYQHPELGWWKYANDRIMKATSDNLSLAQVVEQLLLNWLFVEAPYFDPPESKKVRYLKFYKSTRDQITSYTRVSTKVWYVPQNSGEDLISGASTSFGNQKILVIQKPKDGHSTIARNLLTGFSIENIDLSNHQLLAPYGSGPFNLLPTSEIDVLQRKRQEIKAMYRGLRRAPISVQSYLHEAYLHVPTVLGYMLQKNGNYEQALTWYRQVYDYLQSSGKRKIYHYLKVEQKLPLDFEQADEYLDDSTNPHTIAKTRKNSYTRHILLIIIRCLIDYADALFARDNAPDNARARELYSQTLKLLNFNVLKSKKSDCENILGDLEVEIEEAGQLPLHQFRAVIAEIPDPDRLRTTVNNLRAISWDTGSDVETRLEAMRAAIGRGRSSVRSEAEALPSAKSLSIIVEQDKPQIYATLEAQYLSNSTLRSQFRKVNQQRKQTQLTALATVADTSREIPWLRQSSAEETDNEISVAVLKPEVVSRLTVLNQIRQTAPLQSLVAQQFSSFAINTGVSFSFCIPQNPVIAALRRRAENNLTKLRTCRNIAGFLRQVDPYGAPITVGSGMVSADGSIVSSIVNAPTTPYRYAALIARSKELVNIAQQIESGYQSALEAAEREALSELQAEQNVELASARVTLQDLRVNQANNQLGLAELQKGSAELRNSTFQSWIDAGLSTHEKNILEAYAAAGQAQALAAQTRTASQVMSAFASSVPDRAIDNIRPAHYAKVAFLGSVATLSLREGSYNVQAIRAQTQAQVSSTSASFERRNDEWQLQQGLAAQDILISDQQLQLARDGMAITQQERAIAELEQAHAANILQFLLSKTFTEEMYRWIASVLEDVYRYFLQEAASIARLAEQQLAFERQQGTLKLIQFDYWNVPLDNSGQSDSTDRLGITGSARLLKDIYQLDQYAFETLQLKQSVSVTLDLAELFPFEFQQFRETGVLVFETPQSLIDRQFPGYYLCLIQQVTISVVALIPPTYGIRASLTSAGISQTIVGGDTFQTVTLRQLPERLALTSPTTTSGQILELQPDAQALQRPFEGTGFATQWELRMPKASNIFDYNTIATVLFTVDFTALHSFDYEQQVIEQLDHNISANRTFRFRNEFADAWYDLNNPDLTNTPMVVRFQTRREDFPPNVSDLRVQHLILYFIRKDGETFEVPVRQLHFTEQNTVGTVGGGAQTIDGVISTRRGNGTSWLPMIGLAPFGEWELAFPDEGDDVFPLDDLRVRDLFEQELIEDMLLVITYEGQTPEYPGLV